jgi:hypothetical protein
MNCREWVAAVAFITAIAGQGEQAALAANDKTQTACAAAALTDYTRATVALMQQSPIMSVEATIAKRRLEEQYCLRSTRCLMGEATDPATGMAFAAEFGTCLREEALQNSK